MDVFVCAECGTELTAPVSRVALPVHTHYGAWEELHPPLMEPATYAVDPRPTGPPWRLWEEVGEDEAARQGVYAPVPAVSFGARNRIVIAPGDSRSMVLIPERCAGYCQGLDGRDGPNLACEGCGRAVATRMDDCGSWQEVWLEPDAVARRPSGHPAGPAPGWADLERAEHRVTPVEPDGSWSRRWEAAVGVALAHLVATTEGCPVTLPSGPVADLLRHAVDRYLPPGPGARSVGLAGPGVPTPRLRPDVLLVPRHPLTGAPWRPLGDDDAVAPLDSGVWAYLAHPGETSPLPATGILPEGVLRDDYPLPPRPWRPLTPHRRAFTDTLAGLPAVRSPRLRRYRDESRRP
ncbi:hypothetical protein OHS17_22910 [Streptomyces sp. NBC_00523]|uniref:hypothetical protein n=1 Tax=Streptomyces sp. NBC_00523 TaxID=2975765 RepID=UPI002E816C02|nr:hypothetical protein [Streptomyces sp. NBC_00523]WUD02311.1 hypothetical protein OHS17_22910 [Streptomyces sp. NBC_00523]